MNDSLQKELKKNLERTARASFPESTEKGLKNPKSASKQKARRKHKKARSLNSIEEIKEDLEDDIIDTDFVDRQTAVALLNDWQTKKKFRDASVEEALATLIFDSQDGGLTYDEVKAMLKAAPPKSGKDSSDRSRESSWFADDDNLPLLRINDLQPGDILMMKSYHKFNPVSVALKGVRGNGSRYTVHAALVVENRGAGEYYIAHSNKHGVILDDFQVWAAGKYVVYRPQDEREADMAVDIATWICDGGLSYSHSHSIKGGTGGNSKFTKKAEQRAANIREAMQQEVADRPSPREVLDQKSMMCSEFVTFCFQGRHEAYIKLNSRNVVPPRLEEYCILNPEKFQVVGKING